MKRRLLVLLFFVAAATAFAGTVAGWSPASAAPDAAGTFVVDRVDDAADLAAQGCTAAASDCTLRGAIIKANANPGSTVGVFGGSDYTLTIAAAGTNDATSGDLNVTAPMTITAFCFGPCSPPVVRGAAGWSNTIFAIQSVGVRITGLTIRGGTTAYGGGIRIGPGSALTLTNAVVMRNTATLYGGGIFLDTNAFASLRNSTVISDQAPAGGGLAISDGARAWLDGVTVTANIATNFGGGIFADSGSAYLSGTVLSRNSAVNSGGGFYVGNSVVITIEGSAVTTNSVTNGNGGGIYHGVNSTATINGTLVQGNFAANNAGGIRSAGVLRMRDTTVAGNIAGGAAGMDLFAPTAITGSAIVSNTATGSGGGIISHDSLSVLNSTFSHNRAGNHGGALYASSLLTATFRNATIADNLANTDGDATGTGGGIYQALGGVALFNTILARNSVVAPATNYPNCQGFVTSLGYNLLGSLAGCTVGGDPTGNLNGVDPLLGDLRDNGGPTWTHALLPGSPAIDMGHPSICPPFDQRGIARPVNGTGIAVARCDIGAYEYNVVRIFLPLLRR